ncbi:Sugar transport protein 1 [Zea mays]|uniref:Sugar transport protein 1 n=1 Tax=Zea mays TaxID=4577 RepID=A0A3L6DEJ2_MAIZE|nr:Sugar transport protein 1 [Zea mays]
MAIGAFVEGAPADGGEGYSGRVTPFVVLSCVVAGSGGVLFGYDLGISGGLTSMDCFLKRFFPKVYRQKQDSKVSHYCEFNSELLTVFTSSLYIAGLVATLAAATITRRYGRRTSMLIGGSVFIAGSVFGGAATNIPMLLMNRILLGIGLGFTNQSYCLLSNLQAFNK